jgi:Acetyltransferase (GNAT) domain
MGFRMNSTVVPSNIADTTTDITAKASLRLSAEAFVAGVHEAEWDALVMKAPMGTFLHTRRFLSYHGSRFEDASVLLRNEKGVLVGVMPAAKDLNCPERVVSHPGSTYGGIVHAGGLKGEKMLEAFAAFNSFYAEQGYKTLLYKAVPSIYCLPPLHDDLYALFRLGARRVRCDLSASIDVGVMADATLGLPLSDRRKRAWKTAQKAGLDMRLNDTALYPAYWDLLAANLADKHGAKPVHTLEEMRLLADRFPEEIQLLTVLQADRLLAGTVLFLSKQVVHAQYIASSPEGRDVQALDSVFHHALDYTQASGRRYFDFGISTESQGQVLNTGLYQFKSEFGAGGVVHEFYEYDLV